MSGLNKIFKISEKESFPDRKISRFDVGNEKWPFLVVVTIMFGLALHY